MRWVCNELMEMPRADPILIPAALLTDESLPSVATNLQEAGKRLEYRHPEASVTSAVCFPSYLIAMRTTDYLLPVPRVLRCKYSDGVAVDDSSPYYCCIIIVSCVRWPTQAFLGLRRDRFRHWRRI